MIIDCHYHLDERMLGIDELIGRMDRCGIDRTALMALLNDPIPVPSPLVVLPLQFSLRHPLLRAMVRPLLDSFSPAGNIRTPVGEIPIFPDPDNAPVYDAVRRHPGRFLAWTFVNPRGTRDPLQEIRRWESEKNFIGVKAHPFWHRFAPRELLPVAGVCARLGKPLILHLGFGDHGDFIPLVREVPNLKLVLAHAAFPDFGTTWRAIRENRNIFVDLSQTAYVGVTVMRQVIEYLGPERCLFGTDGPYGIHGADGKMDFSIIKARIERATDSESARKKIFGENFRVLAGIP